LHLRLLILLLLLAGWHLDGILTEYPSMLRGTAVLALIVVGSCFQQRFRNDFQGFAFVYIDRFRTLLLRSWFLGVRMVFKVFLSLIPLTIIMTLPLIVPFVFGLVVVVMVRFLQASLICAANLFQQ
jgi:hypothetical protein